MKKIIIFILCFITFTSIGKSVFASSKKDKAYHGMKQGFGFMVKTRDESLLKPETIQRRRELESMMIRTYNSNGRDMLMQAYNEEVEGFRNEIRNDREGRTHLYQECLDELSRIKALMTAK